nr:reverse transcriptase domain-containing protein [Tanacetum cinerariifolium]
MVVIIESKSKVRQSRAKAVFAKVSTSSSTPAISSEVVELKDMVRALLLDKKNQSSAPASSLTPAPVKAIEPNCVTCGGILPSNTITNPKEDLKAITTRSGVAYQGPTLPTLFKVVKQGTEVTKDQVQTSSSQSTKPIQPLVVQSETQTLVSELVVAPVSTLMPNLKPSIPYPLRRDNERRHDQANEQIEKFYKIFKDTSFEISFTDSLILMPKFASILKALIGNKEKLSEMARAPMNNHSSAVILNKFPRKLRDPGKFLIPCEFPGMDECLALADLDRSFSKPIGIAKDVSVKKELKVCEAKTVKSSNDKPPEVELKDLPPHLEYAFLEGDNKLPIIIAKELGDEEKSALIEVLKSRKRAIAWKLSDIQGINPEFYTHKILMEEDYKLAGIVLDHKISKNEIEVDKAKVDVIDKLPHPTTVKDCIKAFQMLKKKLTKAPILIAPKWDMPFELMCDASDFAIGAVLGQRHEKYFKPIHYASKTMTDAKSNYTTTKKEMLAVVYAFKKFRSYLIMNKIIVHIDHSALKYLFAKKDAKERLLRWVLLLQEFDFKVLDTKGAENLAANHLS